MTDWKLMAKSLYTLSKLEQGRVKPVRPDPRQIGDFATLDETVARSLRVPAKIGAPVPASSSPSSVAASMPLQMQNEALLKKLLQYRNQIPVSPRIIRPKGEA